MIAADALMSDGNTTAEGTGISSQAVDMAASKQTSNSCVGVVASLLACSHVNTADGMTSTHGGVMLFPVPLPMMQTGISIISLVW